jgi:hypothetical protein
MITIPIWLLIIIGIFGFPLLVGIITYLIICIQTVITIFKTIINEL